MMKWLNVAGFVVIAMALWACQAGPASSAGEDNLVVLTSERAEYRLDNGDRLRVTVFGEPELSGEFLVDGTGTVSMPLVGEIATSGKTLREFQRAFEVKLRDGFLNEPQVSAEVVNYRPYYILGEVGKAGEYPYTSGLTVMNAVATAEGFSYRANKRTVYIKGVDDADEVAVKLTAGTRVRPGDTIRIGERLF